MTKKQHIEKLYIQAISDNESPNVFSDRILSLFGVRSNLDLDKLQLQADEILNNLDIDKINNIKQ